MLEYNGGIMILSKSTLCDNHRDRGEIKLGIPYYEGIEDETEGEIVSGTEFCKEVNGSLSKCFIKERIKKKKIL